VYATSQHPMPSLAREKRILKSACHKSGREGATAPDLGVVAEHGQVQEAVKPLVLQLDRPRP
jgi:hypothetical protein